MWRNGDADVGRFPKNDGDDDENSGRIDRYSERETEIERERERERER